MSDERRSGEPGRVVHGLPGLRQRTVDVLCEAFADDRISVEEFERRVEIAHGAGSVDDLKQLVADLPAPPSSAAGSAPDGNYAPAPRDVGWLATDRTWTLPPMARPDEVAQHSFAGGIFGGGSRRGRWVVPRTTWCLGIMGGVELDFRDAIFPPGISEVRALAVWGGVDLTVPPGVRVEVSGFGLMGGFDHNSTVAPTDHPDAPVLRITGVACMGGVEVSMRYPGETGKEARKRLKAERKARQRLGPGSKGMG